MSHCVFGALLGLACLTAPWGAVHKIDASAQPEQKWYNDYETARKAARAAGKPMFVVFR